MNDRLQHIFKTGSKTYFTSSIFFPPAVKEDVIKLYAFLRVADNLVDRVPPDREGFERFVAGYQKAWNQGPTGDLVVDSFVELAGRLKFDPAWTEAFLHSMALDLQKTAYGSMEETLEYVYGSAEVIGLYMARILGLPEGAYPYAMMQGRAMQFINFIRDIREDQGLGRIYLPLEGRDPGFLKEEEARKNPGEFQAFIGSMLDRYLAWQKEAEKGYAYIPWRYLVPIKTASDMYKWTAGVISRDPLVVYSRQVKPSKGRILLKVFLNFFTLYTGRGRHYAGLSQGSKTGNQ